MPGFRESTIDFILIARPERIQGYRNVAAASFYDLLYAFMRGKAVCLHANMDSPAGERTDDLGQIKACEGFSSSEQDHRHPHAGEVVRDAFDLIQGAFPDVGICINDVALLAGQVAAGRDVKLDIDRGVLNKGGTGKREL